MSKKIDFSEVLSHVQNYDVNLTTREVYLHSHFGSGDEEGGVEYRMATTFVKSLHVLNQMGSEPITVHLQSPGGDWGHGIAIFDAIRASVAPVYMIGYGEISSMTGVIFQSPERRVMMPNAELMIHRGYLSLDGVSSTVIANAAWNVKVDRKMLTIFAERCVTGEAFTNKPFDYIVDFIDNKIKELGDWNLSAEESVYYGFADEVYGQVK